MILYVFLVDNGSIFHFDVDLALTSVENLKKAISYKVGIPEAKQVLLISGGESLQPSSRVCSYRAAGTETSPIFLFNKLSIEKDIPPLPMVDYGPDVDMKEKIQTCLFLEPSYNTVVARAELARQLYENSHQQLNICEKIVADQHMQHQGWGAVIANLEDIGKAFKNSADQLKQDFSSFIAKKSSHLQLIENFENDLHILSKIPLLSCLQETFQLETKSEATLLDWINQKDSQYSLKQVTDQCLNALKSYDECSWNAFEEKVQAVIASIDQKDMKEIKGLQSRLSGLEDILSRARKLVHESCDLSKAFSQNQQRASNLRDSSIFPDLCQSHETQLKVASKNYQELREIREKCFRAKKEFCIAIHKRLQWVMHVEKQLADVDGAMLIYRENIRRLCRYLEVINQIHLAPRLYLSSLSEVVRRRNFSNIFLDWAHHLSTQFSLLHTKEVEHRKKFNSILENHFLMSLFHGINDLPSAFATEPPQLFDQDLPKISLNDISKLQKLLPEYASDLDVPLEVPLESFLNYRFQNSNQVNKVSSSKPNESDTEEFETINNEINRDDSKISKDDGSSVIDDNQTNQAAFSENLAQSDYIMGESLTPVTSTLLNMKSGCNSISSYQEDMINVYSISKSEQAKNVKDEVKSERAAKGDKLEEDKEDRVEEAKAEVEDKVNNEYKRQTEELTSHLSQLRAYLLNNLDTFKHSNVGLKNLVKEMQITNQDNLSKINVTIREELETQENVINSLKLTLEAKEKENQINLNDWNQQLNELKNKSETLNQELIQYKTKNQELLHNLNEMVKIKSNLEDKIKEMLQEKENLIASHKSDIECLRGRFKIAMTKSVVEHNLIESSVERIDKDASESLLSKDKQISMLEKKLEECQVKYSISLAQQEHDMRIENEHLLNSALTKVRKEKDAVIDEMKRKEATLMTKLMNFKEKIEKVPIVNGCSLLELLDSLLLSIDDKETLMEISTTAPQLEMSVFSETSRIDMIPVGITLPSSSHSSHSSSVGSSSSESEPIPLSLTHSIHLLDPLNHLIRFFQSTSIIKEKDKPLDLSILGQSDKISVLSCEIGDIVLLCYHEKHQSYLVFSLLSTPHFLHNDCLEVLNLKTGPGNEVRNWALAEITDKEYCQAKKPQNRYKVPVNARFYRIKAKPWIKVNTTFRRSLDSSGILTGYQMSSSSTTDSEQANTSTSRAYISESETKKREMEYQLSLN